MCKASPVLPTVVRYKNHARARSQENPIRVMRIVGQAADIASIRTQHRPLASPSRQTTGQHNRHYNEQLTSLGSESHVCVGPCCGQYTLRSESDSVTSTLQVTEGHEKK